MHGRMPYTTAFERAMGTGMIIQSATALDDGFRSKLDAFIDGYESVLSRFRADSLVTAMGESSHGGSFDFPDWASGLFDLADAFCTATDGALDPCVGYDARYSMTMEPDAEHHLGAVHGRPTWRNDVERHGTTLVTQRAVHLDFGAFGKGYCADLIGAILDGHAGDETVRQSATGPGSHAPYIIDAGGDLLIRTGESAQPAPLAEDTTPATPSPSPWRIPPTPEPRRSASQASLTGRSARAPPADAIGVRRQAVSCIICSTRSTAVPCAMSPRVGSMCHRRLADPTPPRWRMDSPPHASSPHRTSSPAHSTSNAPRCTPTARPS